MNLKLDNEVTLDILAEPWEVVLTFETTEYGSLGSQWPQEHYRTLNLEQAKELRDFLNDNLPH